MLTSVHMYNCTKSNATGFSAYFIMYGQHLILPIDITFEVKTTDITTVITKTFVQTLDTYLQWAS